MSPQLPLVGGFHVGPLFVIRKQRPLARPKGKEGVVHRAMRRRRTPPWVDMSSIRPYYAQARRLTQETGVLHVVDHIVPLCGRIVSGLHVSWNLRVVQWRENSVKGAWFWPGMPFEQMELPL